MSSSTSSPNTIRLRSRADLEVPLVESRWPTNQGAVALADDDWVRVDKLETLVYNDADGVVAADPLAASAVTTERASTFTPGKVAANEFAEIGDEASSSVPSVRLDELVKTQTLAPTAFELPADAFDPVKPRSALEERLVRTFDIVVALSALVTLAPLMLVVALAVIIDSGRPVFYGSGRVGQHQPTFRAWKFRSMRPDADRELGRLLAADDEARHEYETYHKLHRDPRLTRVGGFIRRTSLDELPQLWNVLRGDMSIVGPRPKMPVDAACYGPALDTVLSVRPGLTGLWQISGRNDVSMRDRVILDLRYVHTRTLRGDLWIVARTFVILCQPGRHGAY